MSKKIILSLLCSITLSGQAFCSHSLETADDRGGETNLTCQYGRVERAGVIIVKDYGSATAQHNLRIAALVGADAGRTKLINGTSLPYVNFFAGGCEVNDKYTTVTAIEELYEETGKGIDLPSSALQRGVDANYFGYAYSGDFAQTNTRNKSYNQLFFYRKDDASITAIEAAMAIAAANPALSHRFKETNRAFAIPLQDILDRARNLHALETSGQWQQVQDDSNYVFQTRGSGDGTNRKDVFLDPQYMRNLARDITRDSENLPGICMNISRGLVG